MHIGSPDAHANAGHGAERAQPAPRWDAERRELWFNRQLVKRFKWPADNQEKVLAAFEEEGWPGRIDDPLSPQPEQDPKRRLHDTIKRLNRDQTNALMHFRGDGTGEGVIWELARERTQVKGNEQPASLPYSTPTAKLGPMHPSG
jgi:hypothetical protein